MKPQLERIEVESVRRGNDDLSVHHAVQRKVGKKRVAKLGKVAIERPQIAALNEEVRAMAEHDRAKAVPLRLVKKPAARRQRVRKLSQHRLNRWYDRERHRNVRLVHGNRFRQQSDSDTVSSSQHHTAATPGPSDFA